MDILVKSFVVEVFVRRSCAHPAGILQKIFARRSRRCLYESLQGKPSRGSCTKIFSDPSSRSFFDDCVKFSVRSWLEVLEFLFTDVFLNAVRASLPGMIVSFFCLKR